MDEAAELVVESPPPYVSRGGEKLAHALDELGVDVAGRDALDVGASTGGFTDVLLQRGAARVIALDVGRGQLHARLRADPRVTVLERTNARSVTELPVRAGARDLRRLVHQRPNRAAAGARARAAGLGGARARQAPVRGRARATSAKGGVVRDPDVQRRVLREVAEAALAWPAETVGVVDSGLPGPKGNREFFLHLVHREDPTLPDDLDDWIEDAVR